MIQYPKLPVSLEKIRNLVNGFPIYSPANNRPLITKIVPVEENKRVVVVNRNHVSNLKPPGLRARSLYMSLKDLAAESPEPMPDGLSLTFAPIAPKQTSFTKKHPELQLDVIYGTSTRTG